MANIASQKKRILRTERERKENLRYTSAAKTHLRKLEKAVSSGDAGAADSAQRELISTLDRGVGRGAFHRNTAARRKSRAARIRSELS